MTDLALEQVVELLGLEPHPVEGGYFRESYRAAEAIPAAGLPPRYDGARAASTAIYYLVTPSSFSALHRLRSDELFHFYLGDPVEMLLLRPDGTGEVITIGREIQDGMRPQAI